MTESIIFFYNSRIKNYMHSHFDCCESLGSTYEGIVGQPAKDRHLYVILPKKEIHPFFLVESNLSSYLSLISDMFFINYSIANEDVKYIDTNQYNEIIKKYGESIIIKIASLEGTRYSNKQFNAAYNYFRYTWYQHYSNVAIIATNLYNLKILENVEDIFGIASSYQAGNNRAALPRETASLIGLLYFREKNQIFNELLNSSTFNGVFYKYPVFFDPIVVIKGSFFEEASNTLEGKEVIKKLSTIDDISSIPPYFMKSLSLILKDYVQMKEVYNDITKKLDEGRYAMRGEILLSTSNKKITIDAVNYMGSSTKVKYIVPDKSIAPVAKEEVELPF